MSRVAFLVEGKMEQLIVQSLCSGAPVRLINCNGDNVALEAIARRVGTLGRLLQRRHRTLVIIFDRERRSEPPETIQSNFISLLAKEGITNNVIVGVPDRMFENWILADFDAFKRSAGITGDVPEQEFEGHNGEAKLKALLPNGSTYVKTIHGVDWFLRANPEKLRLRSPSFKAFAESAGDLPCRWLSQKELFQ